VGFLLPAACLGCGEALGGGRAHLGLCLACRGRLSRPAPGCAACGEPIPAAAPAPGRPALPPGWTCGACRRSPPPFDALRAAWSYGGAVGEVIRALKFRRLDYLGAHLARDLAEMAAAEAAERAGGWDLVVPVPLHWRRRLARGYNQAAAIARPLARRLALPVVEALVRRRPTPPQTALPRPARRANPRGAFAVPARHRRRLAGRRVLLVDDVVTTGATLAAAARALLAAGAAEVHAAAVARTPAPGAAAAGARR
jgi:ComF family protein